YMTFGSQRHRRGCRQAERVGVSFFLASRRLLSPARGSGATRPASLQSIQPCGFGLRFTSALSHQARCPLAQIECISHDPGQGCLYIKIIPMEPIAAGRNSNGGKVLRRYAFQARYSFRRKPECESATKFDPDESLL